LAPRILRNADRIGEIVSRECGKPVEEALLAEVLPNADLVGYWTKSAEELLAAEDLELDTLSYPGKTARITREPRGVVALVTPWNYPVAIPLRTLLPALVAGNAVVWKPSEVTPETGELVASLFDELLPKGVLEVVRGGPEIGAELVAADVDLVVFTGSVATGKKIAVACAERFVPCSLELGGKDAAVVLADADVERTARGLVWGAFTNAGQNCASIERAYVVEAVAEKLVPRVVELVNALDLERDCGALTTARQADLVRAQLTDAIERGAELRAGAVPEPDARRYRPVVVVVKDEACALMRDETFGPVLPIVVVKDADEAVRRANGTRYGLTASVWTKSATRGHDVAKRLRAGVVTINNHGFTAAIPSAPWTGVGDSGFGVTSSAHALAELTRPRLLLDDRSGAKRELWWYPYTPALRSVARAMAAVRGGSFVARIKGLFSLLSAFPRRLFEK
ncbi:MAG TPA: aldehyde dehydrogenase family protein, partial [Polyangiaceae bacterium]|nr:aldehyde dehydrogenase family protein [Polyangiaceae bacterium]